MFKKVAICLCCMTLCVICLWLRITPVFRIEKIGEAKSLCNTLEFVCPRGDSYQVELAVPVDSDSGSDIGGCIEVGVEGKVIVQSELCTNELRDITPRLGYKYREYLLSGGTSDTVNLEQALYSGAHVKIKVLFNQLPPRDSTMWLSFDQTGLDEIIDMLMLRHTLYRRQ